MKNAIIFHGTDHTPEQYWYPWLRKELVRNDYTVSVPHYPEINKVPIDQFLPKVLKSHKFENETVLIGHSAGGPLILSILESINIRIKQAILVAGYSQHPDDQMEDPILQTTYNWSKIKQNVKDIVFINSVHDPWSCDDKQGRIMFDKLGGTLIIKDEKEGHFGSVAQNQPHYPKFPLLKALILGS